MVSTFGKSGYNKMAISPRTPDKNGLEGIVYGSINLKTKLAPATVPLSHQLLLVLHLAVADVEEDLMGEKPGTECQKMLLSAAGAWPPGSFGLPKRRHQESKPQCGR